MRGPVICAQPERGALLRISQLSYAFQSHLLILLIRNENNPFLSPAPPTGCSFQPDPVCCHQRSPARPHPGPSCFLPAQPPSPAPLFQVRLSTKSGDLFKFSKIHCFVSKWWYAATTFSLRSGGSGLITFSSEELCPIVPFPKCPKGSSQHINPFGLHLQIPSLTSSFCRFIFKMIILQ